MTQFLLIILLILALVSAIAIFIAVLQGKKAKKLTAEMQTLRGAFRQVKEKAERLQKALGENSKAEEAANAERKELAETLDSDLVSRANNLFNRL
jgi:type II secretory pathway pseudopilin PulG